MHHRPCGHHPLGHPGSPGRLRLAQALWEARIPLGRGAELGEAQLSFDRADRLLAGEELDFVIGSVHLSGKKFANMDLYYIEKGSEAYYDSVIDSYLDDVLALAFEPVKKTAARARKAAPATEKK